MEVAGKFIFLFLRNVYFIAPLLVLLLLIIVLLGQIAGRHEGWSKFDAFYWSFITAFTVGYGDFSPGKRLSKGLSILIALTGVIFTGIIVAVALHAAQTSFREYI